jgi:hypothetical protein
VQDAPAGDSVAGDKIVQGEETGRDKILGGKITTGRIDGVGIAIGPGAKATVYGDIHYHPTRLHAPPRRQFDGLLEDRAEVSCGRDAALSHSGETAIGRTH